MSNYTANDFFQGINSRYKVIPQYAKIPSAVQTFIKAAEYRKFDNKILFEVGVWAAFEEKLNDVIKHVKTTKAAYNEMLIVNTKSQIKTSLFGGDKINTKLIGVAKDFVPTNECDKKMIAAIWAAAASMLAPIKEVACIIIPDHEPITFYDVVGEDMDGETVNTVGMVGKDITKCYDLFNYYDDEFLGENNPFGEDENNFFVALMLDELKTIEQ